jgi:hypothetical protein
MSLPRGAGSVVAAGVAEISDVGGLGSIFASTTEHLEFSCIIRSIFLGGVDLPLDNKRWMDGCVRV